MFTDAEACYSRDNLEVKTRLRHHVKQVKTTFYYCRRKGIIWWPAGAARRAVQSAKTDRPEFISVTVA